MSEGKSNIKLFNNLIGKTVKDTLFFSNLNPVPSSNQKDTVLIKKEEPKQIIIPKRNVTRHRLIRFPASNSDGYKMQSNYGNKFVINNNNNNNKKGLNGELKKMNSIKKNGKLICNIDMNVESQETIVNENENNNMYIKTNLPETKINDKNKNNNPFNRNAINKKLANNKNIDGDINNNINKGNFTLNNNSNNNLHQKIDNKAYYTENNINIQQNTKKTNPIKNDNIKQQNQNKDNSAQNNVQQNHNKYYNLRNNKNNIPQVQNKASSTQINNNIQQNNNNHIPPTPNEHYFIKNINIQQNQNKFYTFQNNNNLQKNQNKINLIQNNNTIQKNNNKVDSIQNNNTLQLQKLSDSKNLEESKKEISQKIIPDKTLQSIYNTKECKNQRKKIRVLNRIPQETDKNIYAPQKSNCNINIIPNETIATIINPISESSKKTKIIPIEEAKSKVNPINSTTVIPIEEDKSKVNPLNSTKFVPIQSVQSKVNPINSTKFVPIQSVQSKVNPLNSTKFVPIQSVQSKVNPISKSNNQIIPKETVESIYFSKAMNNNSKNANIIPQETFASIYQPIKESNSKNIINGKESTLSQMAQVETTSLYKTHENKKPLTREESQKMISLLMPTETIISIYQDPNKKLDGTVDPLMKIMPNETVKSIYGIE